MDLARDCYVATDAFESRERFGLTDQIRRSAVSVPSNIAEGCGRGTPKEFARFLRIAYGSACELGTQLQLSHEIKLGNSAEIVPLLEEAERVRRMLSALITSVVS